MTRSMTVVLVLMALALSACATANGEKPHRFMMGKDFTIRNNSDQVYYATGLADGFTYVSIKTGYQRGLSNCYKKYNVSRPELAITLVGFIERTKAYDRNYNGPPLETLSAVEVFDKLSSLYCKDERAGTHKTGNEKPYSYTTGKHVIIRSFADPANYVMGLADAFAFLSAETGFQRNLSDCYKKYGKEISHYLNY